MEKLRIELSRIATRFVSAVLTAMRTASLSELAAQTAADVRVAEAPRSAPPAPRARRAGRRRHRATPQEVARQKDLALSTARQLKPGFSKGAVTAKSGSKVDLGRALSLLVADGKLTKKGDRRLTRYWVR